MFLRAYVDFFLKRCISRGMTMGRPLAVKHIPRATDGDVDTAFQYAREARATFIHFVTSDTLKFHGR